MNFGLIGAGQIGRVREKSIRRGAGCELTAIADANPARARSLAVSCERLSEKTTKNSCGAKTWTP